MGKNYDELSAVELDCLKEIGNIGSGSAASSLAQMLGKNIIMRVPDVRVMDYEHVIDEMGGPEKIITGLLVRLDGDIKGMIMFLLEESFAKLVLSSFLGTEQSAPLVALDEIGISAIKEMGNIMAGSYLQAIAGLTGMFIDMTVPSMTIDMLGAIMSVPIIEFAEVGDRVLFIDEGFVVDGVDIKSNIILIPEMSSLNTLMKKLGVC
ncbi:MAG: chemotaxis protein CheC [Oscillospiraceae bacterium]|nr:chemotaxis protein CheC [Oscillospiraceae bacterium]